MIKYYSIDHFVMQQLDTFHYSTRKNKWTKRKSENEPDVTITIFI